MIIGSTTEWGNAVWGIVCFLSHHYLHPSRSFICTCQPVKPDDLRLIAGRLWYSETARPRSERGSWALKCHSTVILSLRSNHFFFLCVWVCKWKRVALKVAILKLFVLFVTSGKNMSTFELNVLFISRTAFYVAFFFFHFLLSFRNILSCMWKPRPGHLPVQTWQQLETFCTVSCRGVCLLLANVTATQTYITSLNFDSYCSKLFSRPRFLMDNN